MAAPMLNAGLIEERCQREASETKAAAAGSKTRSAKRDRTNMATFEHTACRREESRKYKGESRKRRRRDGKEPGATSTERGAFPATKLRFRLVFTKTESSASLDQLAKSSR